jgi:methylaspartate mutase sigma subunit
LGKKTLIIGTIGSDAHVIGAYIIAYALREAGFNVIHLGAMVPQEEFIDAAVETKADAILVSSLYGMGVLDCEGFGEKCDERGLKGILLYAGGMLTATEWPWEEVVRRFKELRFDRVYPPGTLPETFISDLNQDLKQKEARAM